MQLSRAFVYKRNPNKFACFIGGTIILEEKFHGRIVQILVDVRLEQAFRRQVKFRVVEKL